MPGHTGGEFVQNKFMGGGGRGEKGVRFVRYARLHNYLWHYNRGKYDLQLRVQIQFLNVPRNLRLLMSNSGNRTKYCSKMISDIVSYHFSCYGT